METILLSKSDIEKVMTMKDVVEIVDKTYIGFGEGKVINPTKVGLDLGETAAWPPYKGFMNAMPAYVGWLDSAGIKWAGGFLDNYKEGLPYITGIICLINPRNGQFRAVMDGGEITNMRTGAQAAVMLKYLHNKKSIRIGLYGAGMQGHYQTMAIAQLFDIEELKVYDIKREASEKFVKDMKNIVTGNIFIADSIEEAAEGDAIICVTQSKDKFVKNSWVKPGTILFAMGSYQECDDDFILTADKIIVDHIGQCLHRGALKELNERGKITEKDIYATIGEIAAGKKRGRFTDKERILCIPIGTGAMDIAVATIVYQRAIEKGLGGKFNFI
ncbi:ornithine cyclodeaminase family protein [Candidatus Bathyarchaeota archaeon]|nr:ornithine cyclodeaminase family protein [Candidatus Bathyarchaeota archaeon]